jgi:hypothetical protein
VKGIGLSDGGTKKENSLKFYASTSQRSILVQNQNSVYEFYVKSPGVFDEESKRTIMLPESFEGAKVHGIWDQLLYAKRGDKDDV